MKIILGISLLLLASQTFAQAGVPTADVPSLWQQTKTYIQAKREYIKERKAEYDEEIRDLETIKEMYDHGKKLQSQIDSLNGDYAMGYLLDTPEYRYRRRGIERSWEGMQEGLGTSAEFAERHGVPVDRGREFISNLTAGQAADHQLARADDRITIAEDIIDAIDDNPDNKAALDLNNRALAEILISMAEDEKTRAIALRVRIEVHMEELLAQESDRRLSK